MANAPKLRVEEAWAFEPWSAVEERLYQQIAEYKSAIKQYSAQIGFDVEKVRDRFEHYAWLALFQYKGMSPERIAKWSKTHDHGGPVPSAVLHGITKIAKKVGLELRLGQRGYARRGSSKSVALN